MLNSSKSSDFLKVGMVSLAQSMKDKGRFKVNEFWGGFEDFPVGTQAFVSAS